MHLRLKQICLPLTFLLAFGLAGQASADPEASGAHERGLSHSEHKRMRGDLERFSREQPRHGDFEKRRQVFRERARLRFHEADRNGNGLLDREELTRHHPNAANNFDEIDHNADGELSEQEVAQVLRQRMRQRAQRPRQYLPQQYPIDSR